MHVRGGGGYNMRLRLCRPSLTEPLFIQFSLLPSLLQQERHEPGSLIYDIHLILSISLCLSRLRVQFTFSFFPPLSSDFSSRPFMRLSREGSVSRIVFVMPLTTSPSQKGQPRKKERKEGKKKALQLGKIPGRSTKLGKGPGTTTYPTYPSQ